MSAAECGITDCPRAARARGLCEPHYRMMKRAGSLGSYPKTRELDSDRRYWVKVNKDGPVPSHRPDLGPCWLWIARTSGGYGRFNIADATVSAHRHAYERLVGVIPEGLQLDHLCRVRGCVNPAHLEPVTPSENTQRAAALTTVCPAGHPYDEANTYRYQGRRACRECRRRQSRDHYLRKIGRAA